MLGTLTMKGRELTVKGLFNDKIDYFKRRMIPKRIEAPFVNPYKKEWVEGVRKSATIDTPADPEAGLPEHEKRAYLQQLATPPFDNSTEAGSRGKSVISRPDVVEYTNRLYAHLGLENVKSRGGRGGEGAVGHKLHFQGVDLRVGVRDEDALRQTQGILRGLQDKATGVMAKRIKQDLTKISKALTPRTPAVGGGGGGGGGGGRTAEDSSSEEEETPAPAPAPVRVPIVAEEEEEEEEDVKYTMEAGRPNSLHSLTYPQLRPIAQRLGIDLTKYPEEKGVAKKLKKAIIAIQSTH